MFVVGAGKVLKSKERLLYKPFSYGKKLCRGVKKCGKKIDKKGHSTRRLKRWRVKLKKTGKVEKNLNYRVYNICLDFTLCKYTFSHFTAFQRGKAAEKGSFVINCPQKKEFQQFPRQKRTLHISDIFYEIFNSRAVCGVALHDFYYLIYSVDDS